ncbi:MAG: hypothetical protein ACKVY0_26225 [Prosthecobacter sp.]|uniref:hypothetical protein n=1 Tax=Prosthecobacter sp. TaxID=1965333 RepID=UPI0038FF6434
MKAGHVFINCPFDAEYERIFHALIFTVMACDFAPRCAVEEDNAMEVRLHKIVRIIEECPLGIHDISRTELDTIHQLPRFNMPFELGIFIGASHILKTRRLRRRALVLDRDRYRYQKFLSDIAGQDIRSHDDNPGKAIRAARDWLAANCQDRKLPSTGLITREFELMTATMTPFVKSLGLHAHDLPFVDLKRVIGTWIAQSPLRRSLL